MGTPSAHSVSTGAGVEKRRRSKNTNIHVQSLVLSTVIELSILYLLQCTSYDLLLY